MDGSSQMTPFVATARSFLKNRLLGAASVNGTSVLTKANLSYPYERGVAGPHRQHHHYPYQGDVHHQILTFYSSRIPLRLALVSKNRSSYTRHDRRHTASEESKLAPGLGLPLGVVCFSFRCKA